MTLSPGGRFLLYFDESQNDWFSYRIADGVRVNLTEKLALNFWREDHDTPNLPPAYGTAGWTADDRSVLLYDKYDIWEVRPDGSNARMVTSGEGRKQADRLPLSLARPRPAGDPGRQAAAALGQRRSDRGQRLLPRQPDRHGRTREAADAAESRRPDHQGEERRSPRGHAVTLRRVPGPVGHRYLVPRRQAGLDRQPAAGRVHLGQGGAHEIPQRGRQGAARHPGQARELRPGEEIPADGLHLRGALGRPAQLSRAGAGHEHQRHPLRQQRLRRADAGHRLRHRLPRRERREVRHPRRQHRGLDGLHRSEADRHPGALVGRLSDHPPDYPDQPVRRGAGRRLGVGHDQRVRRHPLGHRHVARVSVPRRPRAASARRRGTSR